MDQEFLDSVVEAFHTFNSTPVEIYKEGGDGVIHWLLQQYIKIWENREVPQD